MGGVPGERAVIVGGTGQNGKWHGGDKITPAPPARQLFQIIRAHQPDEAGAGEAAAEFSQCVDGEAGAQRRLDVGGDDAAAIGDGMRGSEAFGQRGHAAAGLERIAGGDEQPDLVQAQMLAREGRDMQMAIMGGVVGAAEQADAAAAAVAVGWDQGRT